MSFKSIAWDKENLNITRLLFCLFFNKKSYCNIPSLKKLKSVFLNLRLSEKLNNCSDHCFINLVQNGPCLSRSF